MSVEDQSNVLNDDSVKVKLVNWVKTTRVQTAMVTALALWIGYVTVSPLSIESGVILGAMGLLVHIWGFTLNEVEDYKYDSKHGDADGHPIAKGKVHAGIARHMAWVSGFLAVAVSALFDSQPIATVVLIASFLPGYMYNKKSKTHWWSNIYLSIWASLMVLAGALHAGVPTQYTIAISVALGIQIFVQVVQGDLKDINGEENTFAEQMGVHTKHITSPLSSPPSSGEEQLPWNTGSCDVVEYTFAFATWVYLVKIIEALLLVYVATATVPFSVSMSLEYYFAFMLVGIGFFYTVSLFLVYQFDREDIKKRSSLHELTSIVFLGMSVMGLHLEGGILILAAPIVWYLSVNYIINTGALNPDV